MPYSDSRYVEPVLETPLTMNVSATYLLFNHGHMTAALSGNNAAHGIAIY